MKMITDIRLTNRKLVHKLIRFQEAADQAFEQMLEAAGVGAASELPDEFMSELEDHEEQLAYRLGLPGVTVARRLLSELRVAR